ncbi:S-adenosyl-L-methionine-dependent methyltransferase [Aspergillus pseudonomiae]|uniref:phosphoethanolamine N-methyltransferase n=1 Tax=Aspergillus pseudonomiae TaxID=1506151 RepID=A0A5N7DG73_9EURO|nr:S-adenosyl-L-methionine-dependent methyltransferase [Aspergillus pseudonomiae]KAB8258661.1 S-adenosyl-L-methionine-dependent methyltransferase [Aspergillus pseudonomiae]KAE8405410.1 S-adenosyl-L-methionine-dependent methyltransferase [Aspergillus pseudonomiae]
MTIEVESLFNDLGATYEAAFANNAPLRAFVHRAAKELSPGSRILDVGCGTGKPVADILASAGHEVHGIDLSPEMVKIAQSQVQGTFEVANMKDFHPSKPYDAVFAILSLFQHTPGEAYSLVFKFSEWLKVGGYLAIAVTPSTGLLSETCTYDPTWDCTWMLRKPWMGKYTKEIFYSEDGWLRLLRSAGFVIAAEPANDLFFPAGTQYTAPEAYYYVLARKVEAQPLLGPYPLPTSPMPVTPVDRVDIFTDRLVSKDLEVLFEKLAEGQNVLALGQQHDLSRYTRHNEVQHFPGPAEDLPYPSETFQVVLAPWILDHTMDLGKAIQEMVRVARRKASKIVILQGAPGNEAVMHLNAVTRSHRIDHQGHILQAAVQRLEKRGFRDISLRRIRAHYEFPEEDLSTRCMIAAELLVNMWHKQHPRYEVIKQSLASRLKLHFQGHAHSVGNDMVALVASSPSDDIH